MLGLGLGVWPLGGGLSWLPVPPSGINPGLVLDFAGNRAFQSGAQVALSSTLAFTRATQAWDLQPDGSLVSVASGSPRYGGGLGFLPEGTRTNLLLQSGNFSTSWGVSNTTVTPNAVAGVEQSGAVTAASTVLTAGGGGPAQTVTIGAATTNTISIYAKPFSTNWLRIRLQAGVDIKAVWFNLATGAVGTKDAVGTEITAITTSMTAAANGFYRCIVTITTVTATSLVFTPVACAADNINGAASDSCYLEKSQIELGATATSYITTTTATATRNADQMIISGSPLTAGLSATEGTFLIEAEFDSATPSNPHMGLGNTASPSINNRITCTFTPSGAQLAIVDSAVFQASTIVVAGNTRPIKTRFVARYKANDSASSTKGSAPSVDSVCTIPAGMDRFVVGSAPWAPGAAPLEGRISRVAFWPTGLINSDIQALSA